MSRLADQRRSGLLQGEQKLRIQILCDVNATPAKIMEIQRALKAAGFDPGSTSGKVDAATMPAVAAFKALGVSAD